MFVKCAMLLSIGLLGSCGPSRSHSTAINDFSYKLQQVYTGQTTNILSLTYPESSNYRFVIDGSGFLASVPLGEHQALQDSVQLSYTREGKYQLTLALAQADDTPLLEDQLTWIYSPRVPAPPIVAFTEEATRDTAVTMTIAATRDLDTNQIWVEGDLAGAHSSGGFWDTLSESGMYLLTVTPEDGLKTMEVKLKNIYGTESLSATAAILKKSTKPTDCQAILAGTGSATSTINLQLLATNDGPLFYNIFGDVYELTEFKAFSSGDFVEVILGGGAGTKQLQIVIRDLAGNRCDPIERSITLSEGYVTQSINVLGNIYWTTDSSVDVVLTYDHFPNVQPVEMKLTGDITGVNAGQWIPFQAQITLDLLPGAGDKRIYAQFRDNTGVESFMVDTRVYAQPSVALVTEADSSQSVVVSKIFGAESYTIQGCQEVYDEVAYATAYPCQPAAATISVGYRFLDGTGLTLTATP